MYHNVYMCCDKGNYYNMIIPMENNIKEELKDLYPNYEPFRKKIKSKHYK